MESLEWQRSLNIYLIHFHLFLIFAPVSFHFSLKILTDYLLLCLYDRGILYLSRSSISFLEDNLILSVPYVVYSADIRDKGLNLFTNEHLFYQLLCLFENIKATRKMFLIAKHMSLSALSCKFNLLCYKSTWAAVTPMGI